MAIRQTVYSIFLVSVIADGMREVEESLKDVHEACQAEIDALAANFLSQPVTPLAEGLPRFISWYRAYHNI